MYLCYIDESGVPELNEGTSHFVLLGVTIPVERWRECDQQINKVKRKFSLEDKEIHTGWMLRRYLEQERIAGFEKLSYAARVEAVQKEREKTLVRIAGLKTKKKLKEVKKNFRKTEPYVHLTYDERYNFLKELCQLVGGWGECRIFADAIDKTVFSGREPKYPPFEEAFHQLVSRFETFLSNSTDEKKWGLLIQDNNETVAKRLTNLMQKFHVAGTMFVDIDCIIETPLFVSSALTGMVQIADLCAYTTRRFFEKNETDLFNCIYNRFHRDGHRLVGIRHYTGRNPCHCRVCQEH